MRVLPFYCCRAAVGNAQSSVRQRIEAASDGKAPLLGWKVGIDARNFPQLTFTEAATKADALSGNIAGQHVCWSAEILKAGPPSGAGRTQRRQDALRAMNLRMRSFRESIGPDENAMRKLFEFAKTRV
jgi:hypothetical protein